jgi:hypothetical protein
VNSAANLEEAALLTKDEASIATAVRHFDSLCTTPVQSKYLKLCLAQYRPPKFGPGDRLPPQKREDSREARAWFLGGLQQIELPEEEEEQVQRAEEIAERKFRSPKSVVDWIRYPNKPKFLPKLKPGAWVLSCVKVGRGREVGPPAQVVTVKRIPRPGSQWHI